METVLKNSIEKEKLLFYASLFFLPSTFFLSIILLIISLIISFKKNKEDILGDKYNLCFLLAGIALLISSIFNFLNNQSINNISDNGHLTLIGLTNWIPQIILFIGFQKYLKNIEDRKNCIFALLAGSIPVIVSCFGQLIFNWYGPLKTLFGLIVWYQKPIDGISGVTGLFSNPNYLGAWLVIVLPFCLALIFYENRNFYRMIFTIILTFIIAILIVLTASRSALFCLLLPIPLIYGKKIKLFFSIFLSLFSLIFLNLSFPIFGMGFQDFLRQIIPRGIWVNFTNLGYISLDISRLNIFNYTKKFILDQPLFGYGSRAFPTLFFNETSIWKGHSHNLPLELMISYGIPAALFILIPTFLIIYNSFLKVFLHHKIIDKNTILDRGWIVSLILLMMMHMVDIQYFDGKISITGWILLAGAKNILQDNYNKTKESKYLAGDS